MNRKTRLKLSGLLLVCLISLTMGFYYLQMGSIETATTSDMVSGIKTDLEAAAGDDKTQYKYNLHDWNYTDFSSGYGGWGPHTPDSSGSIDFDGGDLHFTVSGSISNPDYPYVELDPGPFAYGEVVISWRINNNESGEALRLEFSDDAGSTWTPWKQCNQEHPNSNQEYTFQITASEEVTTSSDFRLRIVLEASGWFDASDDEGWVEYINIKTYEFVYEETADTIPQQQSNTISALINSEQDNFDPDGVEIQFKINDDDLSSGTADASMSYSSPYYFYTFVDDLYSYNDNITYRIRINGSGWERFSDAGGEKGKFNATDNTAPYNLGGSFDPDPPLYNEKANYSIIIGEIFNQDSNLSSVFLYLTNESRQATNNDFKIANLTAWSSGIQTGAFIFEIPDYCLTYRDTLNILVQANDTAGNTFNYHDSTSVDDETAPSYSGHTISSSNPEYDESVTIQYDISEPSDASGFDTGGSGIELRYSVDPVTPPSDINDYTSSVSASTLSITRDGGQIDFTLDENLYGYNQTVYYALYIEDIAGNPNNDHGAVHSFTVNDSVTPSVVEDPENTADSNYQSDKYLIFEITEPSDAAGVNDSSLELWFETEAFSGSYSKMTQYFSKDGSDYNFTIQKNGNFTYGDIIHYKLNGTDASDKNNGFSVSGQFELIDLEAPYINYIVGNSNDSIAEYNKDVNITFSSDEIDQFGAGFADIYLLIKNGSYPVEEGSGSYRIDWHVNSSGVYSFLIDYTYLSARTSEELYYAVNTSDTAGNFRVYQGIISPQDFVAPEIEYVSDNSTIFDTINYHKNLGVTFTVKEDRSGVGFYESTDNLDLYYYIGATEPTDQSFGTKIPYESIVAVGGGTYTCVLLESNFAYDDRIYFWANATDKQGNTNTTYESGVLNYVDVIDTIKPELTLDASATDPSSYHIGKDIDFSTLEPSDASGMVSVTLYYGVGNPAVSDLSNNGSVVLTGLSHNGGLLTITIPAYATYGNYSKTMYFILVARDDVGNENVSTIHSYTISDGLKPDIIQDEKNFRPVMINNYGKTLNVTVWDPDYPLASGMNFVRLYYELDDPGVTTSSASLDIQEAEIFEGLHSYTFEITYGLMSGWENGTEFYYMIEIRDTDGNINYSDVESFLVVEAFSKTLVTPIASDPSSYAYYYNDGNIALQFSVEMPCEMWYWIDGEPNSTDEDPVYGKTFNRHLEFTSEGQHNITVFYFDWRYNQTIEFYMDFTAPEPVQMQQAQVNDAGFVQISWIYNGDEDSLTRYQIWRRSGSDDWVNVDTKGPATRTYTDLYVDQGTKYEYRVVVIDRADNISPESNSLSASVPLPIYIWIIIGGIAVVAILVVVKVSSSMRTKRELRKLNSLESQDVDFDIMDEELDPERVKQRHERLQSTDSESEFEDDISEDQWQAVDWRSRATAGKYDQFAQEDIAEYWQNNVKQLVERAARMEINNDIAGALQVYKLALRSAELDSNTSHETIAFLKGKIFNIYSKPM